MNAPLLLWLGLASPALPPVEPARPRHEHDVVWRSPSLDASGSMPLGNGDIGVNAWVNPRGELVFYISKTDSWSDNGRLLKVGRLRVVTEPPLDTARGFEQRLSLSEGTLIVRCGEAGAETELRLWVDANHPEIHVTLDGGPARVATAEIDLWRTERTAYPACEVSDLMEDRSKPGSLHEPVFVEPDTLLDDLAEGIGWYHYNEKSVGPRTIARIQGLEEYFEGRPDPLLQRIFGALVTGPGAERVDAERLRSPLATSHRFSVHVRTEHPSSPGEWLANLRREAASIEASPFDVRRRAHVAWWREFWQRSWIRLRRETPASCIPANTHPFRIGVDPHGANRFEGELGRVTISEGVATPERIAALAATRGPIASGPRFQAAPARAGSIADSAAWTFEQGLTVEAWLAPSERAGAGGRILDKITPGAGDGFLFDARPGDGLRLIVGSQALEVPGLLPRGGWVHVAATVAATGGDLHLFVDGLEVAGAAGGLEDDATTVARAYALQRWVDACAGRGQYPIKFNGSLFTVPHAGKFGDADYRRWGPGYWWQNTRLPYLSMCASGDTEMMLPLFRMYAEELLELHSHRTLAYTGHGGAFIPECIYFWGPTFSATYGWTPWDERGEDKLQSSPWHKWEWVSGLELVWMMLDYAEHTGDQAFVTELLSPTAREVLTFFEEHSPLDDEGKLVMHPSQALETWWDCTNPMPEVSGLRAVTARLANLPENLAPTSERELWARVRAKTPELPTWEENGAPLLAPAERFADKRNVENPELYAVFPFRLVSFEKPNAALGLRALERRWDRGAFGWRQDDLFMTHLGLAEEARANLVARARNKHAGSRFPAFWGPNYDWVPDQDHGGVLMRTLQTMLMQTEGRAIHLLPAWPADWEAAFKLHAPYGTVVSGRVRGGRVEELVVQPESRRGDVVVHSEGAADPR